MWRGLHSVVDRMHAGHPVPSWAILSALVPSAHVISPVESDWLISPPSSFSTERPTLFRERNAWCPFSARVWLAFEIKGIGYDTVRVDAGRFDGRPSDLGGATPQVRWPDGSLLAGSLDIIRELDHRYPELQALCSAPGLHPDEVFDLASASETAFPGAVLTDGIPLRFNAPRAAFVDAIDEANALLRLHGGPFFCGASVSIADVAWAPLLERFAAWLPLTHPDLCLRNDARWPLLDRWFQAMDELAVYSCRLKGDVASWSKVLASSPGWLVVPSRGWQPRRLPPERVRLQPRTPVSRALWASYTSIRPHVGESAEAEAASHIIRHREALAIDASTQLSLPPDELDEAFRALVWLLTRAGGAAGSMGAEGWAGTKDERGIRSARRLQDVLRYLDARVCVPRDMGAPAAEALSRWISQITAD